MLHVASYALPLDAEIPEPSVIIDVLDMVGVSYAPIRLGIPGIYMASISETAAIEAKVQEKHGIFVALHVDDQMGF